jgi:hypothetical protein
LSREVLRTWCNEAIYWHRRRRRMWGRRREIRMGLVLFLFVLSLLLCSLPMVQRRLFIRLDFLMTKWQIWELNESSQLCFTLLVTISTVAFSCSYHSWGLPGRIQLLILSLLPRPFYWYSLFTSVRNTLYC